MSRFVPLSLGRVVLLRFVLNRRAFFSRSAVGAAATLLPHLGRSADQLRDAPDQTPGAIIFMVADGMSSGTFTCADYASQRLKQRPLTWVELMGRSGARTCLMNMRSLNSMVTDSAAAASSWGSGSRVKNGALNELPSGRSLIPIFSLLAERTWKRGLVTTTEITHATPAGFAASVGVRADAEEIAGQYLKNKVDLLLGGGAQFFAAGSRKDQRDLEAEFSAAGYHLMHAAAELSSAPTGKKWLGTFAKGHLPFSIDRMNDQALQTRVPDLAAMTQRALEWMGQHDHFLLQVEGGRVDHAAHNCDAAAALRDMIAFDEALEVALKFQAARPDVLVIVTTDHGNGNLGLNGTGSSYSQTSQVFNQVLQARASFPEVLRHLGLSSSKREIPEAKKIQSVAEEWTGCKVTSKKALLFQRYLNGANDSMYDGLGSLTAQLGQLLANYTALGWTSGSHTADYVPLTAIGPGADRFVGFVQNTEIFERLTGFAGIDYRNPEEPLIASLTMPAAVEKTEEYAWA